MKDLIHKLSEAGEGSRELDALIFAALGFTYEDRPRDCWVDADNNGFRWDHPSTSLDAALALAERVLPGVVFWNLEHNAIINLERIYHAEVSGERDGCSGTGEAKTAPLALCIAILRAKQEQDQ